MGRHTWLPQPKIGQPPNRSLQIQLVTQIRSAKKMERKSQRERRMVMNVCGMSVAYSRASDTLLSRVQLSDLYDRDRLALPVTNSRGKERDTAPHLVATALNRATTQQQSSKPASRHAEIREAAKKKIGEASEDWRRGRFDRSSI